MRRKKHASPVSLFSFQDIVTCLTGIMIVIVLVILLQLVRTTAQMVMRSKLQPEYQAVRKEHREVLRKEAELAALLKNAKFENAELLAMSPAELNAMVKEEENCRNRLKTVVEKEIQLNRTLEAELAALVEKAAGLNRAITLLRKDEDTAKELEARMLALQHTRKSLEQEMKEKKNRLRFEFSGMSGKTPILVECGRKRIRASVYGSGRIQVFEDSSATIDGAVRRFLDWLKLQDLKTCYPVLLVRADAAGYYGELTRRLEKLSPGMDTGAEPIGAAEEVF